MSTPERDIGEPLAQLAAGMQRVTSGNFDTQLEEWPDEPFRSIFADFNAMTTSLLGIEALREGFVSNVAHEFKTPLSYIQGYATLLQDDDLSHDQRLEYASHVTKAAQRLSDMIGTMLELSSLSRPSAHPEKQWFSFDELVRHALAVVVPQLERKRIAYGVDLMSLEVYGNEGLLEDALLNLLSNAVKYTPTDGHVWVTLVREDAYAAVTVADDGCGMTPAQVEHAFDRFYQGNEAHTPEGNGLGLAIVKTIAKKHNGTVSVESKLGHGSAFTIRLPLEGL